MNISINMESGKIFKKVKKKVIYVLEWFQLVQSVYMLLHRVTTFKLWKEIRSSWRELQQPSLAIQAIFVKMIYIVLYVDKLQSLIMQSNVKLTTFHSGFC